MRKLFAVLLAACQCWGALSFGAANTNKVNCGSATAIDDLSSGTIAFWYKPASTANVFRGLMSKTNDSSTGLSVVQRGADGTSVGLSAFRSGTNLAVNSTTAALAAGQWAFIAVTYDASGAGAPILYKGSLSAPAADVSTGVVTGTGTYDNDQAQDLVIGNMLTTDSFSANGAIDAVGIWRARRLTLGELQDYQFRSRPTANNVFFSRLPTTANHADWSGSANACVVTGATVTNGVPIGPWFGFDIRRFLGIDYENHLNRTIFAD